uniref:Uncharacterized protein n=1 Tax=Oryza glumipatula TaxID=40148 RepID=A0A0D9YGN3_9ORYZ
MIALCAVVDVAKAKSARELWSMKPRSQEADVESGRGRTGGASWTKVHEDALETKMVTQSWQS